MQPTNNSWQYTEDGLTIGLYLVAPDTATHYIPVMNLSDATRLCINETRLGMVFQVKSRKKVQEMIWVNHRLSDCNSENDELLDVCTSSTEVFSINKGIPA